MADDLGTLLMAAAMTGKHIAVWTASQNSVPAIGLSLSAYPPDNAGADRLCWAPDIGSSYGNPAHIFVRSSGAYLRRVIDLAKVPPDLFRAMFALQGAPVATRSATALRMLEPRDISPRHRALIRT